MNNTIIILALVAGFLAFRLYSVLGKRTGHEQEPALPRNDGRASAIPMVPGQTMPRPTPEASVYDSRAELGIRAILNADRNFDVGRFMNGAQAAYRMILEAFWRGDRDTLHNLCDADTRDAFLAAIDSREARGEKLDNRLVTIERAHIVDATVSGKIARIMVQLDADIAAVTRDAEGRVIGGSLTDAVGTHDVWTFVRDLSTSDPNWLLEETDVA